MIEYTAAILAGLVMTAFISWLMYHALAFMFRPDIPRTRYIQPACVDRPPQPVCSPGCRDAAYNLTGYQPETITEIPETIAQPAIAAGQENSALPAAEQRVQLPDSRMPRLMEGKRDVIDGTARDAEREKLPAGRKHK